MTRRDLIPSGTFMESPMSLARYLPILALFGCASAEGDLKSASGLRADGQAAEARAAFTKVIATYPDAQEAGMAKIALCDMDVEDAKHINASGDALKAKEILDAVNTTCPNTPPAAAARVVLCEIATSKATTAWSAMEGVTVASDDDLGKKAMVDAMWAVDIKNRGLLRICSQHPDAMTCIKGPPELKVLQGKWARALLAWLNNGARQAADMKQRDLLRGQAPLSKGGDQWIAGLDDQRLSAGTEWVRAAIKGLDTSYTEAPFNITPTDPDPASVAQKGIPKVSVHSSPWSDVDEARQVCDSPSGGSQ